MAQLLPKFEDSHFVLYLDNYFAFVPLFSMLHAENIGAVRTTRPSGTEFPALLIALCQNFSNKLDWGTIYAVEVDGVLCLSWQDNNFVLGLSTIYRVHEAFKLCQVMTSMRNRLLNTSTNATIVRKAFGKLAQRELEIPCFINDYNHHMNSVNLAN